MRLAFRLLMKLNGLISCKAPNAADRVGGVILHPVAPDRHPPTVTLNLFQGPFISLKLRFMWHDGC